VNEYIDETLDCARLAARLAGQQAEQEHGKG
jgi:hypothetical protein